MNKSTFRILSIAVVLVFAGCKKKVEPTEGYTPDFDRNELLQDLSELIYGNYQNYQNAIVELDQSIDEFVSDRSVESLNDLREEWSKSLIAWQHVAPFQFGLASDIAMEASTNIFPVTVDLIEGNIAAGSYNLDAANNLSAIGLQSIDYLINGLCDNDEEFLTFYSSDQFAQNRIQYLEEVSSKLSDMSTSLVEEWKPGSIYRETFVSNSGTSQGSSLGLFLNAFVKSFESTTRTNKIGIPSGAMTFSMTPLPNTVEGYYEGDRSLAYLSESINAFERIFKGEQGETGLDEYLDFLNAESGNATLNEVIVSAITDIRSSIAVLQDPLSEFVLSDQQAALDAFSSMQNLVVLWKVDMMSALGVLITYQDNDGD